VLIALYNRRLRYGVRRLLDSAIGALDRGLRSVFAPARTVRPVPGGSDRAPDPLPDAERRASAALMRVNHAGELVAQALYHGQAFVARSAATPRMLMPRRAPNPITSPGVRRA